MTKHNHEWRFDIYKKDEKTICRFVCSCDAVLEGPDVLMRLNATERLNGATARMAAFYSDNIFDVEVRDALLAYATTLDEDD